ncbi:hypothetical protein ACVIWV_006951 [Bradyrhizobium diazoefficiens]|uniref:hypothetical protein n=1 Tax=Bradyrhizobium TaxID=374 RepID=UPI00076595C5|nr:hypothetical protein [Bradyrhizobium diazoefficiens]MBR0861686.1 hypothetical protein [Bradyrhizobium diazoefficiens]MBR0886171.1 hypothetical protein [Bradyrhizobium diazoefficiens]MBR0917994.1 hypothetical protein [Bradyrhizobium diazoefficiens]
MLTWLDEYTAHMGRKLRLELANRVAGITDTTSDYQIVREVTDTAADRLFAAAEFDLPFDSTYESVAALWPFFRRPDELKGARPYACAVGADLANLFKNAAASPEIVRTADRLLKERVTAYIDIADKAVRIGPLLHVKAVMVMRVPSEAEDRALQPGERWAPSDTDRLRIFVKLGPVGDIALGTIKWTSGGTQVQCDQLAASFLSEFSDSSWDPNDFATKIESFISLSLAYSVVAAPRDREELRAGPEPFRNRMDRSARRGWKRFTLFQVERLKAPANKFGRIGGGGAEGWELTRRISVTGHFKMQPCGARSEDRKLIFVSTHYRGPLDGAPLHRISALRAPPNGAG